MKNNPVQKQDLLSSQMYNIRLSIPKDWIEPLERLRRSNYTTRLELLRRFIREKMQQELPLLNEPKQEVPTHRQPTSLYPPQPSKWGQR